MTGVLKFSKNLEAIKISMRQEGDVQQVSHGGPKNIRSHHKTFDHPGDRHLCTPALGADTGSQTPSTEVISA